MIYSPRKTLRCGQGPRRQGSIEKIQTPQYAFVVVSGGALVYRDEKQEFTVKAGEAFQRQPEIAHQVTYLTNCEISWMAFPNSVQQSLLAMDIQMVKQPYFGSVQLDKFVKRHHFIMKKFEKASPPFQAKVMIDMQELLVETLLYSPQKTSIHDHNHWTQVAILKLEGSLKEDLDIRALASSLKVPYNTFRITMKQMTGCSPLEIRILKRMELAEELLLQGMSIGVVAEKCGYPNIYAFSSQFKKRYGHSPSHWLSSERRYS